MPIYIPTDGVQRSLLPYILFYSRYLIKFLVCDCSIRWKPVSSCFDFLLKIIQIKGWTLNKTYSLKARSVRSLVCVGVYHFLCNTPGARVISKFKIFQIWEGIMYRCHASVALPTQSGPALSKPSVPFTANCILFPIKWTT